MNIRYKTALASLAYLLASSGCHRAQIDMSDAMSDAGEAGSETGEAGAGEAVGGATGAGGHDSHAAGSGAGGETLDTEPPYVISTSPSDGERGVRSDAKIVIRFSEPMNRVQTERAVELTGVPARTEWNELGTELTLVPARELDYGSGDDPVFVKAIAYSFSIARSASDVAGNALDEEYAAAFYTSRELKKKLPRIDALDGYAVVSDAQPFSTGFAPVWAGDSADESTKGFVTFDMTKLPADAQAVTGATLTVSQSFVDGDPFQMGSMTAEHVSFSAVPYVLAAPAKHVFALFSGKTTKATPVDVSPVLNADCADQDGAGMVQFRFAFERASNLNGIEDAVRLYPIILEVTYLAP